MTVKVADIEQLLNKATVEHFQHGAFTRMRLQDLLGWGERRFRETWEPAVENGLLLKESALDYVPARAVCAEFGTLSDQLDYKEMAALKMEYRNAVLRACDMDVPSEWSRAIDEAISELLLKSETENSAPRKETAPMSTQEPEAQTRRAKTKPKKISLRITPSAVKEAESKPEKKATAMPQKTLDPADFEPIQKAMGSGGSPYIRLSHKKENGKDKKAFVLVMRHGNDHFDIFRKAKYAQILVNGKTGKHIAVRRVENPDSGFRVSCEKYRLEVKMIGSTGESAAKKLGLEFNNQNITIRDIGWLDGDTVAFEVA